MGRQKLKLQWITDRETRKAAYKRRCRSLMKKTSELVTLTGTKACVVVYGESDDVAGAMAPVPEVWPSSAEATTLLTKFKEIPDDSRLKWTRNHEQHLEERVLKVREEAKRLEAKNSEFATSKLLHQSLAGLRPGLEGTTSMELVKLNDMVVEKMGKLWARMLELGLVGEGVHDAHPPRLPAIGGELDAVVGGALGVAGGGGHPPMAMNDNGGELAAVVGGALTAGDSSGGDGGPSGGGSDAVEAFSQGCAMGFPWARE
ncbi:hypothetical protein HU200_048792 [Digitaria exilis]|uniref:MADS-box domain-containing protein n=1 Tax=Digitaria exilis TaxID=1010633 RepID=A0A835EBN0_9POAL|nr:hypothetical protein HU200_048792 [Digitaria exilis]CAB3490250.1 unnamed protein product [Digitaria exilis]CAB3504261.1 unnamed protein product [Digitaria exilis]